MKVKEITIGRGRKYSANYQSIDYHVGITIESEGDDFVEDMGLEANTRLDDMESGEDIRCKLIIEQIKAEQITDFKKTYNNVTKKIEKEGQFEKETLVEEEVLMDLADVTIVGETPKSFVVFKKDFQKLVPFSLIIKPPKDELKLQGKYNLFLTENGEQWFHTKTWKPYVPYKGGG